MSVKVHGINCTLVRIRCHLGLFQGYWSTHEGHFYQIPPFLHRCCCFLRFSFGFFCAAKIIKKTNGFSTPPFVFNLAMFLDWLPLSSWSHLLFIRLSNASSGGWINTGKAVLPCRQCHSRCHTVTERRQAHKICGLFICPPLYHHPPSTSQPIIRCYFCVIRWQLSLH